MLADLVSGGESEFAGPALDQPVRVSEGAGQSCGGRGFVFDRFAGSRRDGKFAQDSIHEGSGRAFTGTFHEFDAFVQSGTLRNTIEPVELIESQAQGDEDFEIEFVQRLRGRGGDVVVEARAPAEDAHDEFCRECVIGSGEVLVSRRVQELGGVGGFAFDAEENVEGGGAGGRDGHRVSIVGGKDRTHHPSVCSVRARLRGAEVGGENHWRNFVGRSCPQGLKPNFFLAPNAALKGRSSTVVRAFLVSLQLLKPCPSRKPLTRLAEFFAGLGAIAVEEVAGGSTLLAFQLEFEEFEGCVVAAADQQTIGM